MPSESTVSPRTRGEVLLHNLKQDLRKLDWRAWAVFFGCCTTIWIIGVIDTWLVIKYSDSILDLEQNPICLFLIHLDPHRLTLFIAGKAFGLSLVICA